MNMLYSMSINNAKVIPCMRVEDNDFSPPPRYLGRSRQLSVTRYARFPKGFLLYVLDVSYILFYLKL